MPDLVGAVEVGAPGLADAQLAVARVDSDGVAVDQAALVGDVEDRAEAGDRRVDVRRPDDALAELVIAVAVDFGDIDLRELVAGEERQQVVHELVAVGAVGRGPQLGLAAREPRGRELVEALLLRKLDDGRGAGRAPGAAADVGHDVLQLELRLPPACAGGEGDEVALAVGAEAQGERLAAVRVGLDDLAGGGAGHQVSRSTLEQPLIVGEWSISQRTMAGCSTCLEFARPKTRTDEHLLILLGVVLLVIAVVAKIAILYTVGAILLVVGVVLLILGSVGRAVGGRRHYY